MRENQKTRGNSVSPRPTTSSVGLVASAAARRVAALTADGSICEDRVNAEAQRKTIDRLNEPAKAVGIGRLVTVLKLSKGGSC